MDISSTLEFGLSLTVKSNLSQVINLAGYKSRKPLIHFTQKMFCEFFNEHYNKCFTEYLDLLSAALHQLKAEMGNGLTLRKVFRFNGELQDYYAKHLIKQLRRQSYPRIDDLANRSEFLQGVINRDFYSAFCNGSLRPEETLASVKIAMDRINSRESFTFRMVS